jgi:RNA recognition motif-containing protein
MSSNYSMGKRRRDQEKERKKKQKAERRDRKRRAGTREVPIGTVDEVTGDLDAVERQVRAQQAQPRGAKAISSRLFVGSLSWGTGEDQLREAFSEFGKVTDAVVVCDRDTGKSRGFGFVVMEDRRDAARAIQELDGAELDGRTSPRNASADRAPRRRPPQSVQLLASASSAASVSSGSGRSV